MKILFIEDEQTKAKQIVNYLNSIITEPEIFITKSLMGGLKSIQKMQYDVILLDMSLPLYEFTQDTDELNEFEPFAGIDLLDELKRKKTINKVIVITAFDVIEDDEKKLNLQQLDQNMKRDYPYIYRGSIHYNSSSLEWKTILENLLEEVKLETQM